MHSELVDDLRLVLNTYSAENASNTPDFILAQYLEACLLAFDTATQQRETWYGRDAMDMDHKKHAEAFALMQYACDDCGHRERIWNSRDGVTPFGCKCTKCDAANMLHTNWRGDVFAPGHKLQPGEYFWRDGTPDEAEAIMRRRIEMSRDTYPVTPEYAAELIQMARDGNEEFRPGWPTLDVAKE